MSLKTIDLNEYKGQPYNIGGVISLNIHNISSYEKASFSLRINNNVMYGTYQIPEAIGFSTPLHILGDLTNVEIYISKINNHENNDSIQSYNSWKKMYQGKLFNIKPDNICFSTDKESCSICLDKYMVGDEISKLPLCGHYFHKKCISLMNKRMKCPICRNHAFKHSFNDISLDDQIDITLSEIGL